MYRVAGAVRGTNACWLCTPFFSWRHPRDDVRSTTIPKGNLVHLYKIKEATAVRSRNVLKHAFARCVWYVDSACYKIYMASCRVYSPYERKTGSEAAECKEWVSIFGKRKLKVNKYLVI